MEIRHPDSFDPIGKALESLASLAANYTENQPLTPERFWRHLEEEGFHVPGNPPGAAEHGRFFAHLVLDHAFACGKVSGNISQHHYWGGAGSKA